MANNIGDIQPKYLMRGCRSAMPTNISLETILSRNDKLPTLPGIAIKILEAVQRQNPDLQEIAEVISNDPPLSAEVLKLINSPFFGLSRRVTSVFHAVSMLGMNVIKNIALSFALVKEFSKHGQGDFDYPSFWKYSLTTAIAARKTAERLNREGAEDAFFIGLLHDMGALTLARCLPDQYQLVINDSNRGKSFNHHIEKQIFGFDHMDVGRQLIRSWGLPSEFWQPIGCHHNPNHLPADDDASPSMAQILHLATLYADFDQIDHATTQLALINHFSKDYGFDNTIEVDKLALEIWEEARRFFPYFEIEFENDSGYIETLEKARAELISVSADFIDQLVAQQSQISNLKQQATHDGMTGLMNYQYFQETLNREIARSRRSGAPLTIVLADIDHFKSVNDSFGHLAGDQAIRSVASCLQTNLRETDHIARYGGEEFAMILYNVTAKETLTTMERVRQAVSEFTIRYDENTFNITMSFGIASLADGTKDREAFVDSADKALYAAKTGGRNCCRIFER